MQEKSEYFKSLESNHKYSDEVRAEVKIKKVIFSEEELATLLLKGYRVFYNILESKGIDIAKDFNLNWHQDIYRKTYVFKQRSDAQYIKNYILVGGIRVPVYPADIMKEFTILAGDIKAKYGDWYKGHEPTKIELNNTCAEPPTSPKNDLKLFTDEHFIVNSD